MNLNALLTRNAGNMWCKNEVYTVLNVFSYYILYTERFIGHLMFFFAISKL